jgi:uncharacterized tellurite resistance protein B-like protein
VSLRRWLGLDAQGPEPASDSIAEIERALGGMDATRARYIACFAYLLGRVARADHDISAEEARQMETTVTALGDLEPAHASIVVQIARAQGLRFGGTEDFIVAREFGKIATREQKLALLECLYAVSAADESVQLAEDNEIRRITSELNLEHGDFIAARMSYRKHMDVLRARDKGLA